MIETNKIHNIVVIGSGPAGLSAAIYLSRALLEPILIAGSQQGGQLMITTDVENYPGFSKPVMGPTLMTEMMQQAKNVGTNVFNLDVIKVDFDNYPYKLFLSDNSVIETKSIVIATGAAAKWTGVKGEEKFKGFGVSACATCDGFFFQNKDIVVIGGGNTALEEALFLCKFARKIYLIHRRDSFRGEKILQKKVFEQEKIEIIWDSVVDEIIGDDENNIVSSVNVKNLKNNKINNISVSGVFVAIGHKPATDIFKNSLMMDESGYIIVKDNIFTEKKGIFAAGDVADYKYRQAITAAGYGCMAALEVVPFLENLDDK